ncbi:MAG: putative porin [Bacteroidota bacterium]
MKIEKYLFIIFFLFLSKTIFGQIDSLEYRNIYNWKLNPYDLNIEYAETDTSLEGFQQYNPLLENTITTTYLGNLGTAAQSNIYYDRAQFQTGFIFSEPYGIYFHHPENQLYYSTKKRYTLLKYSNAGSQNESEQLLGVLHTQNITPDFNVGIDYDMISSDGRYQEQQVRQNIVKLFSSYQNKRYRIHVNYYLNRSKGQENGGIDSLHYLGDDEYNNRKNIPVKLSDARNQVLSSGLYLAQEYRFGKITEEKIDESISEENSEISGEDSIYHNAIYVNDSISDQTLSDSIQTDTISIPHSTRMRDNMHKGDTSKSSESKTIEVIKYSGFSLSHELFYNKDARKFFDDQIDEPFYDDLDIFIDSSKTHDEVRQRRLANSFSLHYRFKDKFTSRLSVYNEQMQYEYNIKPDTLFTDTLINPVQDTIITTNNYSNQSNNRISFFMEGILFNHILFHGYSEYYFDGYKKENSAIDISLAYVLFNDFRIGVEGEYRNQNPEYFYSNFASNNFKWENDYLRMTEEWDVGFAIRSSKYRLNAKLRYGQITNHIYFDSTAYLNQHRGQINLLTADISKKITLGPIHSNTRFVYQKSSNDSVLGIPEINLYQSLYYQKLLHFKSTGGELLLQIGVDYRYSSSFYADGYMPPTGMFYRQYDHKLNDFHRFDVFVNFTLKRTRFYFQYSYLNSALTENYYFNAPYYPSPEPVFKYGIAWSFHD